MEERTKKRFDIACDEIGWASISLVAQCCQAFLKVNREYYACSALIDCEARGMEESSYYQILRDGSEENLERYRAGRPAFGATPLDDIPDVQTGKETRVQYNTLALSGYNAVLLRVARIVDTGALSQLVSRIVKQHFEKYWESNYYPQIYLNQNCKFKQEES